MNLTESFKIVGIVLVKNEDIYIEQVLLNILAFCDKVIVADHHSTDNTSQILQRLSSAHSKIEYHLIKDLSESHDLIADYAGDRVWMFAVDGDEIYDPQGLQYFRKELLKGLYDNQWLIFGNVLNCTSIIPEKKIAEGYLAPPCRSMTKLYNFSLIDSWVGSSGERLHGGDITFKEGYSKALRFPLHEETSWNDAKLRCLHMCFLQRSTQQKELKGHYLPRPNPADILSRSIVQRLAVFLKSMFGIPEVGKTEWKMEKFTRGELVEKNVQGFFVKK